MPRESTSGRRDRDCHERVALSDGRYGPQVFDHQNSYRRSRLSDPSPPYDNGNSYVPQQSRRLDSRQRQPNANNGSEQAHSRSRNCDRSTPSRSQRAEYSSGTSRRSNGSVASSHTLSSTSRSGSKTARVVDGSLVSSRSNTSGSGSASGSMRVFPASPARSTHSDSPTRYGSRNRIHRHSDYLPDMGRDTHSHSSSTGQYQYPQPQRAGPTHDDGVWYELGCRQEAPLGTYASENFGRRRRRH